MPPRARRPSTEELLETLRTALTSRLPPTWSVDMQPSATSDSTAAPDATLTVRAPDGRQATIPVEIKQKLDPKDVAPLVAQINGMMGRDRAEQPLVVAPYLSPRTQQLLSENGVSYVTTGGTVEFAVGRPSIYIRDKAPEQDLWTAPREQPLRTLRGPIAGRVVRALCDLREPYGVQAIAIHTNTPVSSVSRVAALLETDALIARASDRVITRVLWADLVRRWTQDYTFAQANTVTTYLEPRGLPSLLEKLRRTDLKYVVTGSMATSVRVPITVPRSITLYVENMQQAAMTLGLRPAERGANVILAEPFDPVVFARGESFEGVRHAAPSQVAADLLTGPGRSPAEGEALLQWMMDHESDWRQDPPWRSRI